MSEKTITNQNYFELGMEYFSVSQCKAFDKCEASALAEARGEWKPETTTALLVGSFVDAWFEGTVDKFMEEHPEIFKKDRTLKADYVQANEIIERCINDELFMEYMSGEKQKIMTGEIDGHPFKIKMDSYLSDKIVDLKVVRSFERIMGKSFVDFWNYNLQGAVYREIESQNANSEKKPFYLAAVTKEKPSDIAIIELDDLDMDEELDYIRKKLPRWAQIKKGEIEPERCECCAYCRATKKAKVIKSALVGLTTKELNYMEGKI